MGLYTSGLIHQILWHLHELLGISAPSIFLHQNSRKKCISRLNNFHTLMLCEISAKKIDG